MGVGVSVCVGMDECRYLYLSGDAYELYTCMDIYNVFWHPFYCESCKPVGV